MNNFHIGQMVQGVKAGIFIILGFRTLPGEAELYAQLKPCRLDGVPLVGEIALPLSKITHI